MLARGRPAVIVALISKKGGVGKTTSAVSLAAAVGELGQRALLVDLDSQASASRSLGVARGALAPSLADVLLWDLPIRQAIRTTSNRNLDLLTASADLVTADVELAKAGTPEQRLRSTLQPVRDDYDLIFLDCPPTMSMLPINALAAADAFVSPVVPQFLAIEGVESLLKAAARVRIHHNRDLEWLGLLLTMVDYRNNATRANVSRLRSAYGEAVFAVEIRVNIRLAEAPEHGRTILEYDSKATGAEAYRLAAEELLLRAGELARRRRISAAV
jgi:chromosome partitioning protein